MRYVLVDNCPVPAKLEPVVRELKHRSGATLNSCYRGKDARALLRRVGKKDQAQLYADFLAGNGNPANPPGRSTHELRSDGVAYVGPVGRRLRWWQVGMDWSNAAGVVRAAREMGWVAVITYPNNPREQHHVNLRREPRLGLLRWRQRPLRRGDTGPRLRWLVRALQAVENGRGKPYLSKNEFRTYDADVEAAVKRFQKDHHLKADGTVGYRTRIQLGASYRFWAGKKKRKPV